ncbi:hypothetical protein RUND412_007101 [Rhizina undulata]
MLFSPRILNRSLRCCRIPTSSLLPRRFVSNKAPHERLESVPAVVRQPPNSDSVHFPGALNSKFTSTLDFVRPQDIPAIPTYRLINTNGVVVDKTREPTVLKEKALKMYRDMVATSVMDVLMYDSQRQGRISFYMVSAGEEGIAVGSAAALADDDVIFMQYREQGP